MKFKYYNLLAGLMFLASCEAGLPEVATPDFNVSTQSATYKAGQLVTFNITGDAHTVSFYSGEPLKEYAYRNGRLVDAGNSGAKLSFTSALSGGSQGTIPASPILITNAPPQLRVLASTDYNGKYDFASLGSAIWTDITSRFNFGTTAAFQPSGSVDISDVLVPGKPLYIAYKYTTLPQATNGTARNYQIESFTLNSNKDIGTADMPVTPTITNLLGAGFRIIDQNPVSAPARSIITTTRISLLGNLYDSVNDPGNDPQSENWAISRAINTSSFDLGIDKAVPIREQVSASALISHTYTYAKPGTYTATFVASNLTKNDRKEVVKEITITITP
jgi:hypothetical protein